MRDAVLVGVRAGARLSPRHPLILVDETKLINNFKARFDSERYPSIGTSIVMLRF